MKLNAKEPNRTLHASRDVCGDFILIERTRYRDWAGNSRWEESRIYITPAEIEKLAQAAKEQS